MRIRTDGRGYVDAMLLRVLAEILGFIGFIGNERGSGGLCGRYVPKIKRIKRGTHYTNRMDELNFCPRCGKTLTLGASYCPACGSRLNDSEADRREMAVVDNKNAGRINIAVMILVIGAVISLFSGIYSYIAAADMAAMMFDMVEGIAPGMYSMDSLILLMKVTAYMVIFGAVSAIVAALLALKRRRWLLTLILCLIASFTGFIFCLISAYLIYKAKQAFKD